MSHLNKNIISSEKDLHFFDDTATYDKGLNWYQQQLPSRSSADQVNTILPVFTARKRSLGQGNVFTPVCHSVHRGVGLPNPLPDTDPPRQTPPDADSPGLGRPSLTQTPWMQTSLGWTYPPMQIPPNADPPGWADPPGVGQTPRCRPFQMQTPGVWQTPPFRYCRQVGGTHPTGMHTCLSCILVCLFFFILICFKICYPVIHILKS